MVVAHLALRVCEEMVSGRAVPLERLVGTRVLASAGIADPAGFAAQIRELGATVQLVSYQDHHPYSTADLERLVRFTGEADYVVVTEKDAVKLRHRWPPGAREPLVALLDVVWTHNGTMLERALASVVPRDAVSSTRVTPRAR